LRRVQRQGTLLLQTIGLLSMLLIGLGGWTVGQVHQQRVRVLEKQYWQNKLKALQLVQSKPKLSHNRKVYPQIWEIKSSTILVQLDLHTNVYLKKPM